MNTPATKLKGKVAFVNIIALDKVSSESQRLTGSMVTEPRLLVHYT